MIWKQGYVTRHMQLVPIPDGRLIVAVESQYQDGSGRKDPGHAEFYLRQQTVQDSPDAERARALLRQTAAAYRDLPAFYFESTASDAASTSNSEMRSMSHLKIYTAPPGWYRMELSGRREDSIVIADGQAEWTVFPASNEYLTQPQAKDTAVSSALRQFAILDGMRADPRIIEQESVAGVPCTLIRIVLDRGTSQRVWIDDSTHLVRKLVTERGRTRSETTSSSIRLNQTVDSALFRYDPAATGARNRHKLARAAPESLTGKPAPDFTLRDLDGREVRLSSLRGKPVLLDFWATWCGYCREALPGIEMLHRNLKGKIAVFGIDNEAPELARDYLKKFGYSLPTLVDSKDQAVNAYHLEGWPTTVVIDGEGKVVYYESGSSPEKLAMPCAASTYGRGVN